MTINETMHGNVLQFSLSPASIHVEEYSRPPPGHNSTRKETLLVGPTVTMRMADFLDDTENKKKKKKKKSHIGSSSPLDGLRCPHHGVISALIWGLRVGDDTRREILEEVIFKTERLIEATMSRHGKSFNLNVRVNLHVTTIIEDGGDDEDGDDGDINWMVPAAKEAIAGLSKMRFGDVARGEGVRDEIPQCVICHEDYEGESLVTRLKCCHVFHCDCLCAWLKKSHYCPLCRFELPTRD